MEYLLLNSKKTKKELILNNIYCPTIELFSGIAILYATFPAVECNLFLRKLPGTPYESFFLAFVDNCDFIH